MAVLFTIGWIAWIVYFCILEFLAIKNRKKGDTLSEHVWVWFGVRDKPNLWAWIRRVILILFMVWLSLHFILGV